MSSFRSGVSRARKKQAIPEEPSETETERVGYERESRCKVGESTRRGEKKEANDRGLEGGRGAAASRRRKAVSSLSGSAKRLAVKLITA